MLPAANFVGTHKKHLISMAISHPPLPPRAILLLDNFHHKLYSFIVVTIKLIVRYFFCETQIRYLGS